MVIIDNILHGPPSIEVPNGSLGQYILDQLQNSQPKTIEIYPKTGQSLTSHEILKRSVGLAKILEEKGVMPGDTLAISSENIPNWFVAACATIFRGAIIAPMNPAYYEGEVRHCLSISRPKIIFVSQKTEKLMKKVVRNLSWDVELIQLENESMININTVENLLKNLQNYPDPYKFKAVEILRPKEQEAAVLYSSGTTGLPKGVMLSHHNIFMVLFYLRSQQYTESFEELTFMMFLPFFHGYAFAMMLFFITAGIKAIIMPSFEPILFCESIQKYKVTTIPLVPPIMVFLAKHPMVDKFDFSSVREIFCGAAPLSEEIRNDVSKRFKNNFMIRHGYGMTELSVIICISSRNNKKAETIGSLAPGTLCKVIDPLTSKALKVHQIGELCFKGDYIMLGYRNDPKSTMETIKDGWLHSGDLGYYDNDEDLFITGRLKELIKYKGFQVSPMELENILLSSPDVDDAAVVGRDDEEVGQVPVAFVVKKKGSSVTAQALSQFINERVSPQKRLRGGIHFVDSIPKNAAGKILRRELEQLVSKL